MTKWPMIGARRSVLREINSIVMLSNVYILLYSVGLHIRSAAPIKAFQPLVLQAERYWPLCFSEIGGNLMQNELDRVFSSLST